MAIAEKMNLRSHKAKRQRLLKDTVLPKNIVQRLRTFGFHSLNKNAELSVEGMHALSDYCDALLGRLAQDGVPVTYASKEGKILYAYVSEQISNTQDALLLYDLFNEATSIINNVAVN